MFVNTYLFFQFQIVSNAQITKYIKYNRTTPRLHILIKNKVYTYILLQLYR